jgi:hypothetical protein
LGEDSEDDDAATKLLLELLGPNGRRVLDRLTGSWREMTKVLDQLLEGTNDDG